MNQQEEHAPAGLYQRYNVTKKNGEPTDPRATYFVLRLDKAGRDPVHTKACRAAAHVYAAFVQSSSCGSSHLAQVGRELADLLNELDPPDPSADRVGGALIVGIDPHRREVVINLDYERTGHLTFSPNQARGLAGILKRKADEIEVGELVCRPSEVGGNAVDNRKG